MDSPDVVHHYFPELTADQKERIEQLGPLYEYWNSRVNVISRKDIQNLYTHHILHCLGIAKTIDLSRANDILDLGTGGGLPGIPLAILHPDTHFHLVDATRKKLDVVKAIVEELGLENVTTEHQRAEKLKGRFDLITGRAVKSLPQFLAWVKKNIRKEQEDLAGIAYLKGGDLEGELEDIDLPVEIHPLAEHFEEPYYETKYVVHLKLFIP